jgi:hypothetical protein
MSAAPLDGRFQLIAELTHTLNVLVAPGDVFEVRAPRTPRRGTVSGYYTDQAKAARDVAASLDGKAPAVYLTLNPVRPDLLARAHNRLVERADVTTADADIARRRWLPLDFDAKRPAGISSTDAEHQTALDRAEEVTDFLTDLGWPQPICADSGNGAHRLYRIDLPNDMPSTLLVGRVLKGLAATFSMPDGAPEPRVALDATVGNAARIWKPYPTWVRKGDDVPERPHRRSRLISVPEAVEVVTREQLEELADFLAPPDSDAKAGGTAGRGSGWITDAGAYLREHNIAVRAENQASNAHRWVLEACVWNPDHTDHSAWVLQFSNGAIAAGCSHNSCSGKKWPDFRDAVEPGWRHTGQNGRTSQTSPPPVDDDPPEAEPEQKPVLGNEVAPFPLHVLPARIQAFIKTVAAAVSCPPDLVAVPALVVLGAAIGNSVVLEVNEGWLERASLWALVVARSGDGKSPAHDHAVRPLQQRQSELYAAYRAALADWRARKDSNEAAGPKPRPEHAAITDTTLEALANALLASPRGLLMDLDEATAWVMAFNQYRTGGKGADRPHWLKMWSSAPTTAIRATREEPVHIPATFVAVTGNIPPDKLTTLGDEAGDEDGFVARVLFSYPVPIPAAATEHGVPHEVAEDWGAIVDRLLQLTPQAPGDGQKGIPMLPAVAQFSADGRRAWYAWLDQHAQEMNGETFADSLRAPWSKFRAYISRLALIVAAARWACGERGADAFTVDAADVEAAAELVRYFKAHCRRAYAFLHANPATREALGLLEWMRRHRKLRVTGRNVARAKLRGLKDTASIAQAFNTLAGMGYGHVESKRIQGGPQVTFTRGNEA